MPLLRSAFIALSHNGLLRGFCESSRLGRGSVRALWPAWRSKTRCAWPLPPTRGHDRNTGLAGRERYDARRSPTVRGGLSQTAGRIAARKLNANISVKLTQMGLDLSPAWRRRLPATWPSTPRRPAILYASTWRTRREPRSLWTSSADCKRTRNRAGDWNRDPGLSLSSQSDIEQLIAEGIRVRLCKGAYKEPAKIAFGKRPTSTQLCALEQHVAHSPIYHGWPRTMRHGRGGEVVCPQQGIDLPVRIPDAVWRAPRPATQVSARGLQRAPLYSIWPRVVSLLHAPPGGAPGQRAVHCQEFVAEIRGCGKTTSAWQGASGHGFRAVPQFTCPFRHRARWHFLEKNAT